MSRGRFGGVFARGCVFDDVFGDAPGDVFDDAPGHVRGDAPGD